MKKRPSARATPRGLSPRKKGPPVVALTCYVPPETALRLRLRAVESGRTASAIVTDALGRELGRELAP